MKKVLLLLCFSYTTVFSQAFWERTEPYFGAFNKLFFVGGDTIYGTLSSGFSRSTNNGTAWSTPVIVNYVNDITVTPNGYIFVAQNSQRMSRSTNKGASWTIKGTGITEPSCSSVLVSSVGTIFAGTNAGIYRSTNNGDSWTKVAGAVQLGSDTSISTMATYNGTTMYAFTRLNASIDKCFAIRSTDDGITWTKSTSSVDTATIYKAVIHQNGNIYAQTGSGVRYSTNGGNSWSVLGFYNTNIGDVTIDQSGALYATVSYKDTTSVLYKTTNNGISWSPIKTPYVGNSKIGLNKKGDIFLSQDQLYRSTNNGDSWKALPVSFPNVSLLTESPKHELFFTAGGIAYQNLYRSSDFGQSWKIMNTGVVGVPIVGFYGDTIFVGDNYYQGKVYRSTDNGKSFTSLANNIGLGGYVNAMFGTSFTSLLAGTSNGIYRSTNTTKSWTKVHSISVNALKQSPNGTLFARREWFGDGIYRSIDNGSTWQQKIQGMTGTVVRSLDIASNGVLIAGTDGGIFRSTDNAENWIRIDTQKVAKPYGIFAAINNDGRIIIGGAKSGVNSQCYQSTNNGATWQQIENNIATIDNNASINGLFAASDGHIFTGTTSGLFRSTQVITAMSGATSIIPNEFSLSQNYPNPFNPATTINFTVRDAGMVTLTVYDLLGRKLEELVNTSKQPGSYAVKFDASKYSSGMYFYFLQSGPNILTKKMSLIR